jgi:hypothetical protein
MRLFLSTSVRSASCFAALAPGRWDARGSVLVMFLMFGKLLMTPAAAAPSAGVFNGFTTSGIVGSASSLKVTNGITIEAWIRPGERTATSHTDGCILLKEGEYQLARFADGTIRWALATTSPAWNWYSTGFVAPESTWTHVALTYDGLRVRTYGNGRLVQTQTASGPIRDVNTAANTLEIGSRTAATQRFSGLIDEVRLWNLARSTSEIRDHHDRLLAGNEVGLIGYWRFDEGSGTTFRDTSPFQHHGTLQGGGWSKETSPVGLPSIHLGPVVADSPTSAAAFTRLTTGDSPAATFVEWAPGIPGLNLDGIDDFVSVPHSDVFNGDPSNGPFLTATAWVRVDPRGSGGLVNKYAAGSSNGWQMYLYNGELRAWYFASNARHVWGPTVWTDRRGLNAGPIDDGQWHHTAFQVDTSGGYLYVDGSLRASLRWTGSPGRCSTTLSLSFGQYAAESVPGFQFLEGILGEVAFWRTDLPAGAIQQTMRGEAYYPDFLVGRWRFDHIEDSLVQDLSGKGNHGSLVGQPILIPVAQAPVAFGQRVATPLPPLSTTSVAFDGVDDHLESTGDLNLANQSFTVEFWARRASTGTFQSVFSQTRGNSQTATLRNRGLHIGWRPNDTFTFAFFFNDLDTPDPWSDLDWHHWACTYDRTTGNRRIYRDGVVVAADVSDTPYNGTGPIWIGLRDFSPTDDAAFSGAIRDVRVWGQALPCDTLQSWQTLEPDARHPAFGSLKAWWPLSEGAGTTARDRLATDNPSMLLFSPPTPNDGPRWQIEDFQSATLAGLPASTAVFVRAVATNHYGVSYTDAQVISLPTPIAGNALSLDRIPAVARLGPYDDLKATSSFTVELWTHPVGVATNLQILAIREGEYGLSRTSNGQLQVAWSTTDNAWAWKPTDAFLPTDTWTHVALTFDGASVSTYINGIKASHFAASGEVQDARASANILELGRSELAPNEQFTGMLDDLRLWSIARVPSEIRRDFNRALRGDEPGLIAYYPFDESPGDVLRDRGPRRLDGRLVGATRWVASTAGLGQVFLTTLPATETEYGKPVLHGTVKTDDRPVRAYFVWGEGAQWTPGSDTLLPPVYTASTAAVSLPGLSIDQPISAVLPLLGPGTYHFALRVESGESVVTGNNQTFVLSSAGGSAAIRFDGVDDFIQLGTDPASKMTNAFTVEAWIQPHATNRAMMIINREGEYELGINGDGELWWAVANRSRWVVNPTGFFPPANLWTHVALVFDAGIVRVYRDGALVQTSTGTGTATALGDQHPDANELRVGSRQIGGTYFMGLIDEVRLWNIAVPPADLQRRRHQRLRGDESGLVFYLPFDEGLGSTSRSLADDANGALTNGALWAPSSLALDMPPSVGTSGANPLLATAATLTGWVNPAGTETVAWFTWWPVTNQTAIRRTPNIAVGSGEYRVAVSSPLSGLPATSTFEFQLHASSQDGSTSSESAAFTTLALECGWPLGITSSGRSPGITTVTHDSQGNTIVAGHFSSTTTFGSISLVASVPFGDLPTSGFIAKVTPAGEWVWARSFEAHLGVTPRHIATVDADSVLVAGQFGGRFTAGNTAPRTSAGERDGFVARLSPSGDWLWSLQLGATDNATLTRIAADPKGPIWCVGAFSGTIQNPAGSVASVGGSDALLARLDLSGTWRSFQQAGGSADDHAVGLQLLPSGRTHRCRRLQWHRSIRHTSHHERGRVRFLRGPVRRTRGLALGHSRRRAGDRPGERSRRNPEWHPPRRRTSGRSGDGR